MNAPVDQILSSGDTALAYFAVAGATCVVYDHLTTLDVENRPKWRIPQALFIINRYVGLGYEIYTASFFFKNLLGESTEVRITFDMVSQPLLFYNDRFWCTIRHPGATFNLLTGFLTAVVFFAMHGIMVYRISSMYTHDRKILRILTMAYVTEFLSVMIIQLVSMMYGSKAESSEKTIQAASDAFCTETKVMPWLFVIWIPLVLFEFLIFCLALSLGIKYHRAAGSHQMFSGYRNSNRKTPLLYILLRDSIIFPFFFSLSCIINIIIFLLVANRPRQVIADIASLFPVVLSIIFGSRLILNLRESYYESYDAEFSIHIDTSILLESEGDSVPFPTQIPLLNLHAPTIDS